VSLCRAARLQLLRAVKRGRAALCWIEDKRSPIGILPRPPVRLTAGAMVPFEIEMLKPISMLLPERVGNGKLSRVADDRRFAEAVYKVALANGVMDRVGYLDLAAG
jgi:hypothetical protein